MSKKCKCFGCEELNDCYLVDISEISKHNKKYFCKDCIFEFFETS